MCQTVSVLWLCTCLNVLTIRHMTVTVTVRSMLMQSPGTRPGPAARRMRVNLCTPDSGQLADWQTYGRLRWWCRAEGEESVVSCAASSPLAPAQFSPGLPPYTWRRRDGCG